MSEQQQLFFASQEAPPTFPGFPLDTFTIDGANVVQVIGLRVPMETAFAACSDVGRLSSVLYPLSSITLLAGFPGVVNSQYRIVKTEMQTQGSGSDRHLVQVTTTTQVTITNIVPLQRIDWQCVESTSTSTSSTNHDTNQFVVSFVFYPQALCMVVFDMHKKLEEQLAFRIHCLCCLPCFPLFVRWAREMFVDKIRKQCADLVVYVNGYVPLPQYHNNNNTGMNLPNGLLPNGMMQTWNMPNQNTEIPEAVPVATAAPKSEEMTYV